MRTGWSWAGPARVLGRHVVPLLIAALFVTPLLAMLLGSLRPLGAAAGPGQPILPRQPSLESFRRLDAIVPLWTYARNSAVVVAVAVPLSVLVASWAGFGIRLLSPRLRRAVVVACVVVLLVPVSALWATRFQVYAAVDAIGTLVPLIAPALLGTSPFLVLVYAWAFHGISDSQLAAARLEGAGSWTLWRRIAMPQVRTATVVVAVLSFTFHWANFIDALLYLRGVERFTLPVGLDTLKLLQPTEFSLLLAGALVFTLPSVAVFLAAHRVFDDDPLSTLQGGHR